MSYIATAVVSIFVISCSLIRMYREGDTIKDSNGAVLGGCNLPTINYEVSAAGVIFFCPSAVETLGLWSPYSFKIVCSIASRIMQ